MLSLSSPPILFRASKLFFLLVLVYFLLMGLPVEAQEPAKKITAEDASKSLAESLKNNPWSNITGFRSAKFGADEKSVYRAIAKDFKLAKSKVTKAVSPTEKTASLTILVPDLFKTGGPASVGYIFGYKSKKLMHVNILWGAGASKKTKDSEVITTANLLRTHFLKKRYKEEGLVANGQMSKNATLVFRGKDKKNRMVTLVLKTALKPTEQADSMNQTQLVLSYILDPLKSDIRKIVIEEGEF
jgi:hypothetical protein